MFPDTSIFHEAQGYTIYNTVTILCDQTALKMQQNWVNVFLEKYLQTNRLFHWHKFLDYLATIKITQFFFLHWMVQLIFHTFMGSYAQL